MNSKARPERPKILYVEDDPASVTLVRRLLEGEGYEIVDVSDGLSAIEVAKRDVPDLILMDINISGLDGYEVTTRLRSIEEMRQVPIVAVTAATLKGDRERSLIAGCNGYIPKPIYVDTFPNQVRSFLMGTKEEIESAEEKAEYLVEYSHRLVDRLESKIRELEQAHADLQRVEKMKSDFIILASHELRTPLTSIYGHAQLLLQDPAIPGAPDEEGSARYLLQRIADATQRLDQVFDEIRNVSLIDADRLNLARDPVMLKALVLSVVENLQNLGPPRDLQFELKGLENLPVISGDTRRLHQAVWNIVGNAMKCTPDGGRIRIVGRQIEDTIDISVEDTGVGIPPEERERIFNRFYVLEDTIRHHSSKTAFRGGGLGLGLAVARGIIKAHGGKIWAESEGYDEENLPGSTFHILLPLERGPSP
ncbi:MAG TPA: hybrid sensor histidine kinase/response regulator [Anaerolineae bacterium]|nr:hybrid sensor histidine kinase/response regulator [Anaerolineae bacterium]